MLTAALDILPVLACSLPDEAGVLALLGLDEDVLAVDDVEDVEDDGVDVDDAAVSSGDSRYAVALMSAFTAGNPPGPAVKANPSMLSRRPLTSTRLPSTRTNRWTSLRNCSMSKKLPLKTNANGIVGKPAEPTV